MKRNKLLKKVLTLGLTAAVAVTSMGPTLSMLNPVVAYAGTENNLAEGEGFKASDYYKISSPEVKEDEGGNLVAIQDSISISDIIVVKKDSGAATIAAIAGTDGVKWKKYDKSTGSEESDYGSDTISESGKYAVYIKTGELDNIPEDGDYVVIRDHVKLTDVYICEEMNEEDITKKIFDGDKDVGYEGSNPAKDCVTVSAEGYNISDDYEGTYNESYIFEKPSEDGKVKKILYFSKEGSVSAAEVEVDFDVTAPVIAEVTASSITANAASVKVSLTGDSKEAEGEGTITYRLTNTMPVEGANGHIDSIADKTDNSNGYVSFDLTELTKNTDYTFTAVAVDAAGNESDSIGITFKTLKDSMTGDLALKTLDNSVLDASNTIIGTTLKVSGITDLSENITYKWYRVKDGSETPITIAEDSDDSTYTLTADDDGSYIKVVASADGYEDKTVTTTYTVDKKPYAAGGKSISVKEENPYNVDDHTLTFTLSGDVSESDLEYSVDGGETYIKGDAAGSILTVQSEEIILNLGNKAYAENTIKVRFAETAEMKAGGDVAYTEAISATLSGTVTLSGTFKVGGTITATVDGAQEGAALKYQFKKATYGAVESGALTETNIGDNLATNTLVIAKEQLNCYITVAVTADGYDGTLTLDTNSVKSNGVVGKGDATPMSPIVGTIANGTGEDTWKYTITNTDSGAKYKKGDNVEWGDIKEFDSITPNTDVTFYAYIPGEDEGREDSEIVEKTVHFPYKTHEVLTLNYSIEDGDGEGKKVTINLSGLDTSKLELTFDGENWTSAAGDNANVHTYTDLSGSVRIGIRYAENPAYDSQGEVYADIEDLNKGIYDAPTVDSLVLAPNVEKTAYIISSVSVTTSGGVEAEYSLDGTTFKSFDEIKEVTFAAEKEVRLYVRVKADDTHNASPVKNVSATTNSASAAPTITLTPGSGAVITGTGTIHYTTDGSEPGVDSATYSDPIATSAGMVIKAIAVEDNKIKSSVTTETIPSTSGGNTDPGPSNPSGGNSGTTPSNPGSGSGSSGGSSSSGSSGGSSGGGTGAAGTTPTPSTPTVTTTPDGTVVATNKDGAYVDKNGNVAANTVVKESTGVMHVTDSTGHIAKDDVVTTADGTTYVVGAEGNVVVSDIAEIKGNKYVADENGELVTNAFSTIGGEKYYSDAEGLVKTDGFFNAAGKKYYADEDGAVAVKKLVTVDGKKYFATKTGAIATKKIVTTGGKKYFATKTGAIASNKVVTTGGKKYFATKNGTLATNKWVKAGNKKYFCNKKGVITKTKKIKK